MPQLRALSSLGVLLASLTTPALVAQQNPVGRWVGHWEREGSMVEVEVTFARSDSGYMGSFSSDQLRVVDIPFRGVSYEEPRLAWKIVGDFTTTVFEGTVKADTLAGRFREGEARATFRLTRAATAAVELEKEEITFSNGPVTLGGTVIYPAGAGPFPGVVFLHGSGAEGRWASAYLANALARRGVAALIYDKRGVGASTGDWQKAGFEELVGDASAAVETLRSRPRILPGRVGLHGHSQGGTIAPWVASENPHTAFVVASAAGGIPSMAETEIYSISNSLGVRGMSEADRGLAERYVRALVATAYQGAPRTEAEAIWQEVRDRPWAFPVPEASDPYWGLSRRIASYEALAWWRRVTAPVLLVYGELDERVPPRVSAAKIAEAYLESHGSRLDIQFFPAADHTFRLPPNEPGKFQWPRTVAGYPDQVIEWILQVTRP